METGTTQNFAPLLKEVDVAKLFRVTPWTVRQWRLKKIGPRYVRVGHKTIRYHVNDLNEWVRQGGVGK